jgi:hypothetical protein
MDRACPSPSCDKRLPLASKHCECGQVIDRAPGQNKRRNPGDDVGAGRVGGGVRRNTGGQGNADGVYHRPSAAERAADQVPEEPEAIVHRYTENVCAHGLRCVGNDGRVECFAVPSANDTGVLVLSKPDAHVFCINMLFKGCVRAPCPNRIAHKLRPKN